MNTHVTYHAGERFLQRVFNFTSYSKKEVIKAMNLLTKEIATIQHHGHNFVLPSFPSYRAIVRDNALVTIIPK